MVANAGGITTFIQMLYTPSTTESAPRMGGATSAALPSAAEEHADATHAGTGRRAALSTGEAASGMGVACMAALALSDLARGDLAMQQAVISSGGVGALLHLLRNGSQLAQEHAASAFLHLCESPANQQAIVDAGLIAELLRVRKHTS